MKVIISDQIIKELSTVPSPVIGRDNTASAKVFSGKNIVKKVSKQGVRGFLSSELSAFKVMEQHPDIFGWTKVVNDRLVIQERMNATKAQRDYLEISRNFYDMFGGRDFRSYLEDLVKLGSNSPFVSMIYKQIKRDELKLDPGTYYNFMVFTNLCKKLHKIYSKNKDILGGKRPDLHAENFGYDKHGNLKVFDFLNPYN